MSRPHVLSYRWILIGSGIIVGLNFAMRALFADPVKTRLITSFSGLTGVFVFVGLIAFFSFFVGGAVIGLASPGETLREPAYAALIATSLNALENFANVDGHAITVLDWLIGSGITALVGFLMALCGAWVGEKIQGRTSEKLRQQSDPGPRSTG